ncbi:hypothetical protein Q5P01_022294 [Channa striata]|uniref:Tc1-like transposase DDE domain-containing protein n=1 Tax=Channa striata TaxID=64152 RepID=A0AA88IWZ3_CHASR|nr:hypothetical protein Q5P01_022294 [Channa striata]
MDQRGQVDAKRLMVRERRRKGGRRGGRGRTRAVVSDEIRATIIDPMVNHGLSLREAGLRVVLEKHKIRMKQFYTVSFERRGECVKNSVINTSRERNFIRQQATVDVPGQRGANITMCAATPVMVDFYTNLSLRGQRARNTFVVVWDHVACHHSAVVTDWFAAQRKEEFFSTWSYECRVGRCLFSSCVRFFPRCIARENIKYEVDENMSPNAKCRRKEC